MSFNLELSEHERYIYNTHLRITRKQKNKPYNSKKDFSDISEITWTYLKKISAFLKKFPHIKLDEFILAPFIVYPDEQYFSLEYYTTLKATKAYTVYKNTQQHRDPDNSDQLKNTVESLKFISLFCKDRSLAIAEYLNHKTGNIHSFILHLKEHRINVYSLFGFFDFERILRQNDTELLKFILGENFLNNLPTFRIKYFASKKSKKLVELGIQKITS